MFIIKINFMNFKQLTINGVTKEESYKFLINYTK